MTKKRCSHCGKLRKLGSFHKDASRKDGRQRLCKNCVRKYQRSPWKATDRKVSRRQRTLKNFFESRTKRRVKANEYHRKLRTAVIEHYGRVCQCCGEVRYEFLAIDHIEGGGHRHRVENKIGRLAPWLVTNGFPEGFRVLCHNCNIALGHYGNCPHRCLGSKLRPSTKKYRKIRREVLRFYGGPVPAAGKTIPSFLQLITYTVAAVNIVGRYTISLFGYGAMTFLQVSVFSVTTAIRL